MKSEHAELISAIGQLGRAIARLIKLSVSEQIPKMPRITPDEVPISQPPAPQAQEDRPKTKQEIAEYFGVTSRTVDGWMAAGHLPYWKIGHLVRFDIGVVRAALDARHRRGRQRD